MRKQTRYMLLCAILAVLPFSAVHAADISLESVRAAGDEVTVKGKAAKNEEYVTMKVLKKDESSDILTVAQEKSGEDGSFEIEFSVPEEYDSAPTDVYYIITLHLNNSQAGDAEYEFKYVTPENREAFLDILKTKTPEEIIASMEENSEYKDGFKLEGALTDEFFALPEDSGLKLLSEILEGYNREDMTLYSFADDFNKIIYFTRVNSGEEIFDLLLKLDPSFEEEKFSALRQDRQELFAEIISRNIPYESYGGFLDGCTSAGAILKLNTARYSDIDGIMSEYKDELELAGDSSYNKYLDLSSSKKQSVCEKIVQSLDKDKIYTTEEFRELLKEAVDSLPTTGSSSGSGGSSGGSGGSGYMPGKNPAASNNQKTDVEENSPGGVTAVEADVKEPQQTAAFDDLDGVEWARDAILDLAERGVISGKGDNKFDPNGLITREEFVKIIVDAAGVHDGTAKSDFDDVVEGSWYESYVASAVAEGIAAGRSENIFGVGEPITRQDVCVMAAKLADGGEDAPELAFDDAADIADYARQSVQKLAGLGVVSGMGDNKFCPTDTCTRAQAAMIVSGILEKK